ncbi:unnamed protein product, partial [Amoebophrya sp. A25]|eukprot:GSA25T00015157001.1
MVDDANVEIRGERTDRLYVIGQLAALAKALKTVHVESARTIWDDKGAMKTLDFSVDISVRSLGRLFGEEDPVQLFHQQRDIDMSEDREKWYYPSAIGVRGQLYSGDAFYQEYHGPIVLGMTPTWTVHDPARVTPYQALSTAEDVEDDIMLALVGTVQQASSNSTTNVTSDVNVSDDGDSTSANVSAANATNGTMRNTSTSGGKVLLP